MISPASWLTLGMFSPALSGGATPPQTSPLLLWFLLFLVRSSANVAKKIQELAEDKAENPRTCRGQSREKKSVRTPTRKLISQSFVLLNSSPYRNPPYSKNFGRRYSPPGGLQSAAQPGTACWIGTCRSPDISSKSPSGFFFSEVLVSPS